MPETRPFLSLIARPFFESNFSLPSDCIEFQPFSATAKFIDETLVPKSMSPYYGDSAGNGKRALMERNNVAKTYTDKDGKFAKGNPGRPVGSRNKSVLAMEGLLDGEAEALGRKAVALALAGDTTALRLCIDRVLPARKDSPVPFYLPPMGNAKEAATAAQGVLEAVSGGDLTPLEATTVMGLVERYGRVLELSEFEDRLLALEKATRGTSGE